MTSGTYKAALKTAKTDLANAMRQRDFWNVEIARLQQLVKSLSASVETKPADEDQPKRKVSLSALMGVRFTDLVHSIVNNSEGTGVTAADVKKALEERGYDLSEYSNPSALIHQTLKRLQKDRKIGRGEDGKYRMDIMEFIMDGVIKRQRLPPIFPKQEKK